MNISEIKSVSHHRNTVTVTMNDGTAHKEKYRYAADARNAHAELKNQLYSRKIGILKAAFDASAIEAATGLKVLQVDDTCWKIGEKGTFSVRIYADCYMVSTRHIPHCSSAMPQATWEGVMEQVSRDLAKQEAVIETEYQFMKNNDVNSLTVETKLTSSHNGFTHTATVTRVTKTQAIATTENGVQVRLKIEGSNGTWQTVGSDGHPRDCWKMVAVDVPVIAAPTIETPVEKKEKELAAALAAVRKMAHQQDEYPIYEIRLYRAGKAGFETRASFDSLIEWMEKHPKHFRSHSPRSNRFLIGGMLYHVIVSHDTITVPEPMIETIAPQTTVKAELAAHLTKFIETDKRELAKAADIHPAALSRVLNGSQLSFTTLESLMSALNLALRPSVFMTVWTARNMETLDTEFIIDHYLERAADFTPLQRGKLFDFILQPRISDTEITPFDGCRWRVVKLGKRRLAASLDSNGLFRRYVVS